MYTLEQGLVKVIAKGVRKPAAKLAGHLEPGTLSEIYVARSRGIGQITGAITLNNFDNIRKNFEKLIEVFRVFQFFLKNFSEEEKDERIFKLLCEFLTRVESLSFNKSPILEVEAFWWKLFDALGNGPEIMKCADCKKKLHANFKKYFSFEKGGTVCAACVANFKGLISISNNQIKLLRVFWGNSLEKITKVKIGEKELEKLITIRENYTKYHFH